MEAAQLSPFVSRSVSSGPSNAHFKSLQLQFNSKNRIIYSMFAIVRISGKQYKVSPQDVIDVDHILGDEGSNVELKDVLLTDQDGDVTIGHPVVSGSVVTAKIVKQFKGEKINVRRYKSKVRYRKSNGFRAVLTSCALFCNLSGEFELLWLCSPPWMPVRL